MDFAKIRQIDGLWHASFWLLVMRFVNIGAALLLSILLSRTLGAEQYGIYAFGLSVLMIAVVPARFGFDQYLASEIPALASRERYDAIYGLIRNAYQTSVAISLAILGLWLLLWLAWPTLLSQSLWLSGTIALAALPFFALLHTRYGVLRGQHRTVAGQLPLFVLQPLLATGLAALAIAVIPSFFDGLAAQLLFAISIAAVWLLAVTRLHPPMPETWRNSAPNYERRSWWRAATPMMLASGYAILIGNAGVLLLGPLIDERAAGLYQPATQLAAFVSLSLAIINQPLGPRISQLYAERRMLELQQLINKVSAVCLAVAGLIGMSFIIWGEALLSLYGIEFSTAASALSILVLGQLANVAFGPTALILMMTGNAPLVAKLMAFGAALCLLLSFLLIPGLGIEGAAIAASSALIVWNALAAVAALRKAGLYSSVLLRVLPAQLFRKEPAR